MASMVEERIARRVFRKARWMTRIGARYRKSGLTLVLIKLRVNSALNHETVYFAAF